MKLNMRKYVAEFFGTLILVFLGCGTAMLVGCDAAYGSGYMLTACAFGLAIVAGAYSIGNISGCHVNPAVSLALLLSKRMNTADFIGYCISQILGAFAGSGLLLCVFGLGGLDDLTNSLGANGLTGVGESWEIGLLIEIILTFIFVLTILGVTSPKENHGSMGGLVIGLTLMAVHIIGIGLTGTSVNPARSIAPAVYSFVAYKDGYALSCLWVFIAGPFLGAAAAAGVYAIIDRHPAEEERIRAASAEKMKETMARIAEISAAAAGSIPQKEEPEPEAPKKQENAADNAKSKPKPNNNNANKNNNNKGGNGGNSNNRNNSGKKRSNPQNQNRNKK